MITRHYLDVNGRRVHYRKAGRGPPLLMAHQSPRSSAEYAPLMARWAEHFTCIAPDTPGFGQSDPLPGAPEIDAFGDAMVAFVAALGLDRVAAYGFHSGGIILMNALKRHPERFATLAIGGYAIWTEAEMRLFGDAYLPPFVPQAYGEHLTWLWNRVLEQSWFFPWFDVRDETRLSVAHDDPDKVHAVVMDMLDAGDAYRAGYGAVLRAPRDIPLPDAVMPPVLIAAYDGDPLQPHIDRLGPLPQGWSAKKLADPAALEAAALRHLQATFVPEAGTLPDAKDEGFLSIETDDYCGLVHWRGDPSETVVTIPAPGRSAALVVGAAIDPPGHGLSDPWPGNPPVDWVPWRAVLQEVCAERSFTSVHHEPEPRGDAKLLFGDVSPDRFGAYLLRAWSRVRASHFFEPWYQAAAATCRAFDPADLAPERLAAEHRALLRANAAKQFLIARRSSDGEYHVDP